MITWYLLNTSSDYHARSFTVRWTATEVAEFDTLFKGTLPKGKLLKQMMEVLPSRTEAQIRTRAHNIISGKLKN